MNNCVDSGGGVFLCFYHYCGIHVENIKILSWKRYTSAAQYTVYFQIILQAAIFHLPGADHNLQEEKEWDSR